MQNDKDRLAKNKEDNFTPALKALLEKLDNEKWQIVTFELYNEED